MKKRIRKIKKALKILFMSPYYIYKIYQKIDLVYNLINVTSDITNMPPAREDSALRQVQLASFSVLKDLDAVCKKHNIQYWLDSGTVLGAIRHGGYIPWDDDIDIGMMRDDYNRFIQIVQNEEKDSLLYTQPVKVHLLWYKCFSHKPYNSATAPCVDIFPADYLQEDIDLKAHHKKVIQEYYALVERNRGKTLQDSQEDLQKTLKTLSYSKTKTKYINYGIENMKFANKKRTAWYYYDDFFPLKEISFEGMNFFIPNNFHKNMMALYGNYMLFPTKFKNHANLEYIKGEKKS